ncbi:MAG: glycosyltransferase family 9 protein [Pseudomonadota bacterium]
MSTPLVNPPRSICLLRLSAIGDCCHALALVRTLQHALPDTQLSWVIGRTEAGLMQGLDGVELLVYDKQDRHAQKVFATLLRDRQFDVLLNLHASWRANRVSRRIYAPRKIGFDRARARDAQWLFNNERIAPQHNPHVLDGFFGFAERLGIMQRRYDWSLPIAAEDYVFAERVAATNAPTVVISPCSSERRNNFRNWPAERFVALAEHATQRHGATIIITGGVSAVEHEYAQIISDNGPAGIHNLVGKTTLKQLAALIDRASVLIAPDSGPVHIATAVGTPVVGLYATSNPGRTGPVLSEHTINAYPEALQQFMGREVSEVRWGQRVRHRDAMSLITTDQVCDAVDAILA